MSPFAVYAVALPIVLEAGLAYLFVTGTLGVAGFISATFALGAFTTTAVIFRSRRRDTEGETD